MHRAGLREGNAQSWPERGMHRAGLREGNAQHWPECTELAARRLLHTVNSLTPLHKIVTGLPGHVQITARCTCSYTIHCRPVYLTLHSHQFLHSDVHPVQYSLQSEE